MRILKHILKTVLFSVGISVVIRIVFGLYSVFGHVTLLVPIVLSIFIAFSLSVPGKIGFFTTDLLHVIIVTTSYILLDYFGLFLDLASNTADFFSGFVGTDSVRVNLLWCILFVMPVYFFSFIIVSGIISSIKSKRRQKADGLDDPLYDMEYDPKENRITYR